MKQKVKIAFFGSSLVSACWNGTDAAGYVRTVGQEDARGIGSRARERILDEHTCAHRVELPHLLFRGFLPVGGRVSA